jgi:hypothetical protein
METIDGWSDAFGEFVGRFAGRFGRVEPRRRMASYLPRPLNHYLWDADLVRDDVRDAVVGHIGDPEGGVLILDERCRAADLGDDVEFATKPDLGLRILKRAVASGIPFGWVTADEPYGQTGRIRMWLEEHENPMSSRS